MAGLNTNTGPRAHRVLLVGGWDVPYYEQAMADGLRACGAEVMPFEIRRFLPNDLWTRLEKKALCGPRISRLNRELLNAVAEHTPDIVFLFLPLYIYPSTVARIRERFGALVISHNHDNPYEDGHRFLLWRNYHAVIRHCDVNFTSRPTSVEHAVCEGVPNPRLMKQFYIAGVHRPIPDVPPDFRNEVVFVGHYEPDGRDANLEFLLQNGVPLRIFGPEWHRTTQPAVRAQNPQILHGEDYVRTLAGAKIALVFLSVRNKDFYTTRCFEIPACGTLMIAPRNQLLKAMFAEGREAVYYDGKEELLEKIRFYLTNDDARQRIARAGYERCIRDGHSNIDRAREALCAAEEIFAERSGAATSEPVSTMTRNV